MKCIVVVDKRWGIGKNNDLLFNLKEDMAFFKKMTVGKTIVVGSNTLRSFPNGKPLPSRKNVVLSKKLEKCSDYIVVRNVEELLKYDGDDTIVCGGSRVYALLLPYCDTAYVTKVDADGEATHFFPNLDEDPSWKLAEVTPGDTATFCKYERIK